MELKVDRRAAVKKLRTLVITSKSEVEPFRKKIEDTFKTVFLPNRVELNEHDYGGIKCDVLVPEVYSSKRTMIYIHGGSFCGGSRESWRGFCASLAHASSTRVIVPEFRLPPTFAYPAGLEDIQTVFRLVYAEEQISLQIEDPNAQPEIILASDGTGCSLAVSLLLKLREKYRKCVKNLVLLSPCLDFSNDNELIYPKKQSDEVMSGDSLHRCVDLYTYASNFENPLISPLKAVAENYVGFPHVYIQMGEKEILKAHANSLIKLLEEADVTYTYDVWPKMMFMFQMADEYLEESHLAIEKLGKFLRSGDDERTNHLSDPE